MSRYNRCKECYNMDCIFVTGEREDIDTSKCADFRSMTNADRIRSMTDEELADFMIGVAQQGGIPLGGKPIRWVDWLKSPVGVET